MSKYLVTGANGVVGRALCDVLAKAGIVVCAAVRSKGNESIANVSIVGVGDIDGETNWNNALSGVDVVLHLAAMSEDPKKSIDANIEATFRKVNVEGTRHLARMAQAAGVRRFVYVSSIGVNGKNSGALGFDESSRPSPEGIYALSKFEAEQELAVIASEGVMEIVVIRSPLVYGAGISNNLLRLMRAIDQRLPLPLGAVKNERSLIYIGNLVDALAVCASHPNAAGKTYLVSDDETVSTPQLVKKMAVLMHRPNLLLPLPYGVLRFLGRVCGKIDEIESMMATRKINNSRIKKELGWHPPYSLDSGLSFMVRWFSESGKHGGAKV